MLEKQMNAPQQLQQLQQLQHWYYYQLLLINLMNDKPEAPKNVLIIFWYLLNYYSNFHYVNDRYVNT